MTTLPINESGMTFGPFPPGHCFYIEESEIYKRVQHGVQMAEFLLLRPSPDKPPTIWIIEAKSSTPRPETQPNFDTFIQEIRDKLTNALSLGLAACLNRHPNQGNDISEVFRELDLSATQFRLILVVNGHNAAWLPPLRDALVNALRTTTKLWALSPNAVVVINDEIARSYNLIS